MVFLINPYSSKSKARGHHETIHKFNSDQSYIDGRWESRTNCRDRIYPNDYREHFEMSYCIAPAPTPGLGVYYCWSRSRS
jgi:hypothetical protein